MKNGSFYLSNNSEYKIYTFSGRFFACFCWKYFIPPFVLATTISWNVSEGEGGLNVLRWRLVTVSSSFFCGEHYLIIFAGSTTLNLQKKEKMDWLQKWIPHRLKSFLITFLFLFSAWQALKNKKVKLSKKTPDKKNNGKRFLRPPLDSVFQRTQVWGRREQFLPSCKSIDHRKRLVEKSAHEGLVENWLDVSTCEVF